MGRALHKLTATKVAKLTASGLHLDGGGLYLRVGTTGGKSWVFRYKRRDMGWAASRRYLSPACARRPQPRASSWHAARIRSKRASD